MSSAERSRRSLSLPKGAPYSPSSVTDRPVWYLNWGTNEHDAKPTALREALDYVKAKRGAAEYEYFASRLSNDRLEQIELRIRGKSDPNLC